jgi:signal transduction histidine kinase
MDAQMGRSHVVSESDAAPARVFFAGVSIATITAVTLAAIHTTERPQLRDLLGWIVILAIVELLPVPVSKVLRLSLGFPILLGIAILYAPAVGAAIAVLGSFDAREFRREISIERAAFNRAQIALATWAASSFFHSIASIHSGLLLSVGAILASSVNYAVNVTFVAIGMHLLYGTPIRLVLRQFRAGALHEFLLNYLALAFVGVVIAHLFLVEGFWAVAAFILPLVFARQMFLRSMALEEAGKELKDRERVLRALSNRMAEERQDERMQIAGYLHDDLAQQLFRLTLQTEMAKKRLSRGDAEAALRDLDGILDTRQQMSDTVRALIRDLHRSPIGRKGLAEAIHSFAEDMSRGATVVTADVVEVALPPPIQLLIYQIAREATINSLKHAEAAHIGISLVESEGGVALSIEDDGKGLDVHQPQPEGHLGSVMMKERALVAGGTYERASEIGKGTTILATFPRVWVEEGAVLEARAEAGEGNAREAGAATASPVARRGAGSDRDGAPALTKDPLGGAEEQEPAPVRAVGAR